LDWFVGGDFHDNFVHISLGLAGMPARPGRTFAWYHGLPNTPQTLIQKTSQTTCGVNSMTLY
jgi:hypothetical protein